MSVYATRIWFDADSDHGQPYDYQGSHILPADTDPRYGSLDIASIPGYVERDGQQAPGGEDGVWPWLRVAVNNETVVLDLDQVRHLTQGLLLWVAEAEATP